MYKIRTDLVIRMLRTESPASLKCCHQMVTPRTIGCYGYKLALLSGLSNTKY